MTRILDTRSTVGFDKSGKILALDVDFYSNAGYTIDLSAAVMERALSHADNAYNIGCVHAKGYLCKTNLPSNTAFRGFGGPQAMLVAEDVLDQVCMVAVTYKLASFQILI
jgi:xanthine dehydrogenase/oxidase